MSDRVSTTFSTLSSAPGVIGPRSARHMIVGQTQKGPGTQPVIVRSLAQYLATFGARSGGTSMYDAAQLALRCGVTELVVQRAVGPTPVKATVSLDTGKIVVTAKEPGSFANSWTAAWTAATSTLTVVGATTETFVGATAADLIAAVAATSTQVTITSSGTLPSSNVAATSLASGADDFANVVWANQLAKLSPDLGDGSVAIPGVAYGTVGQALATHCASTKRHGFVTAAAGASVATLVSAQATIAAYTSSEHLDLVAPWQVVPDGAGGVKTIDPTGFAAGLRSKAKRAGAGASAAAEQYARDIVDVTPEYQINSADWATLNAAHVSTIRTVGSYVRLYNYTMVKAPGGNNNIIGGQYRDVINYVAFLAEQVLEGFTNLPASGANLAQAAGQIAAICQGLSGTYLSPRTADDGSAVDPGFKVEVTTGTSPSDNRIAANISLRLAESFDFVDLVVAVGDASVSL